MFPDLRTLSYADRLQSIGLWSLEERRNRSDLLEVFRMYKGWSRISFGSMFTLSSVTTTTGHTVKIAKNRCLLDSRRHFFSERVIDRWNRLPQHIIDSVSFDAFKSGLDIDRLFHGPIICQDVQASSIPVVWNQTRPHLVCRPTCYIVTVTRVMAINSQP